MIEVDATRAGTERPAFGRWLLNQADSRENARGEVKALAAIAKLDRGFPRDGTPEQVSAHLNRAMADQEQHEALESAIYAWQDA